MELNEYQVKAMTTCMPSCENVSYMLINLVGEVGELASKIAKAIRKEDARIKNNALTIDGIPPQQKQVMLTEMKAEAGDVLWQLSGLCAVFGWPLEEVAQANLDKLASRKQRGVIDGNGDNR